MTANHSGINLIIADVLENLLVPLVSNSMVPEWNKRLEGYFEYLFSFAPANLHDDAVLLVIHPNDPALLLDLRNWAYTFDFELLRDWWGLNILHISSSVDRSQKVCNSFDNLQLLFYHFIFMLVILNILSFFVWLAGSQQCLLLL
jgi:hypothetical protein